MDKIQEEIQEELDAMPDTANVIKHPKWIPQTPGDTLIGEVVSREKGASEETENLTFLAVKTDKETFSVLENSVLNKQLNKLDCVVGDYVGLTYLGEVVGKKKRIYKNYKIVVKKIKK